MSYNLTQICSTTRPDGTVHKTFQIYKKNRRFITSAELHKLVDNLYKKNPNADFHVLGNGNKIPKNLTDDEVKVRGLGIDKWHTGKNFGKDLKYDSEADYYFGKVNETSKFIKYFQIQLTITIPPKKDLRSANAQALAKDISLDKK